MYLDLCFLKMEKRNLTGGTDEEFLKLVKKNSENNKTKREKIFLNGIVIPLKIIRIKSFPPPPKKKEEKKGKCTYIVKFFHFWILPIIELPFYLFILSFSLVVPKKEGERILSQLHKLRWEQCNCS